MSDSSYMHILRLFMITMPVLMVLLGWFVRSCIRGAHTNQPAFWLSLICIGILFPEILRALLILAGEIPPHLKHVELWIAELIPFGGLGYAIVKRYWKVVHDKLNND